MGSRNFDMTQKKKILVQYFNFCAKTWSVSSICLLIALLTPSVANSKEYWKIEKPQSDAIFLRQFQSDESKSQLGTFAFEIACVRGNLLIDIYSRRKHQGNTWQNVSSFDEETVFFKGKYEKIGAGKNVAYVFTLEPKSALKLIKEMKLNDEQAAANSAEESEYFISHDDLSLSFRINTTNFRRIAAGIICLN
jgi:hypothetical protein